MIRPMGLPLWAMSKKQWGNLPFSRWVVFVEDAVEDWKEIGFDIDEVIKAEEDAKKEKK